MRISDCNSDVCSSDLQRRAGATGERRLLTEQAGQCADEQKEGQKSFHDDCDLLASANKFNRDARVFFATSFPMRPRPSRIGHSGRSSPWQRSARSRSEEHTSELQSLMRISYAVFCLKKKIKNQSKTTYKPQVTHHIDIH